MKKQTLLFLILINAVWASIESVCAQNSPNITYSTPQIFTVGTAISTLSPTNTGGAVYPGNYAAPTIFTPYTTPFSLAVDASNNVYTTNNTTGDLTKFSSDGTVVFTVNTGFNQASGIGVDGAGNIYVSQFTANTVLRYNSSGQLVATIKNFSDPYGIAFDSSNNAYIANYHTGVILKVAANDTTATTYISGLNTPYGIAIDAAGNMYVGEEGVGDIIKFASGTLAKTVFASGFNGPRHLNKDSFGNIYVADFGNNAIKKISPTGTVTSILSSGLTTPRQAAFDSSGNLFIADFGTNNLKKSLATKYSITGTLPAGLSFDTSTGEISGTPTVATAATTYTITAYNTGGSGSTTLTITVNSPVTQPTAPTVTLDAATNITATSATLNGSVNSNGQATNVTFTYSENSDFTGSVVAPATTGSTINAGDSANPTLAVTGLKPAATYYYLITAKNPSGSITRGGDSFTTLSSGVSNTISFTALASKTYGDADFDPGASVNGGGTISYSSDNTAVATIVNGEIHIVGAGSANITAASANAGNVSQNLVINKAILTVTANSISRNAGVANPALTVAYSGFVNGDNSGDLTTQPSITTTATINSAAGTYPITAAGAASDNYTFTYVQGVLTVTQGTLAITFNPLPAKTYGDADFDPGASVSGGGTVSYSSDNTTVATIVNGEIHIVGAGSANITAASQNAGNVSQNIVINKATLTVTANSISRNVGVANPALTVAYQGFVNGDNSGDLTTQPTISTTATINSAADTYPITVAGAASDNYTFTYVQGVLTVTQGTFVITFNPISAKTYGDADFDPGASVSGGGTVAYSCDNTAVVTIVNGNIHIVGAGSANITAASQNAGNVSQNIVINKAALTITANSVSRNAGVANPALTFVYSGFVNGDGSNNLTTQPVISTTATINSAAGNYPITVSGAVSDNYTFNYVQGVLTITPGTLTLTFNPIPAKTYGDADFDPGASAGNGATIIYTSDNPDVATIVNGKVHIVSAGTANITATQGDNTVTQNLVINKANQTISFAEIPNQITGTTYDLSTVSASSGLPVTLTSADVYVGTIDGFIFNSLHSGTTMVTASQAGNNNYNAAESVTIMVTVANTVENDVIVHQAVSPNGDGKNDFLLIDGIQNYPNKVTLINQNGGKIYEVSNYDNNTRMFDGHSNLNGAFQLQGTYYYLIEYTKDNKTIKKTGFFVLKY